MAVVRLLALSLMAVASVAAIQARVAVFQSDPAVWQDAVRTVPLKPRAWTNLGCAEAVRGNLPHAAFAYQHAIELAHVSGRQFNEDGPALATAEADFALLRFNAGEQGPAQTLISRAVDELPNDPHLQAISAWINHFDARN